MTNLRMVLADYIEGVAHVGFIVDDLSDAVEQVCRVYGLVQEDIRYVPEPGEEAATRFAFYTVGGMEFELIEPVSEEFRNTLFSTPSGSAGINHMAWRVRDIEGALACLLERGIKPGHVTPQGIVTIGPKKMVYLDPATTGGLIIELLEYPDPKSET